MNPLYDGTFLFDNDFPALQPNAPDPGTVNLTSVGYMGDCLSRGELVLQRVMLLYLRTQ